MHAPGDLALRLEAQSLLRAAAEHVEMTAHRPEEAFGAAEAAEFGRGEQPLRDEFGGAPDLECVFANPQQGVEIAQGALAVLDVGFDDVAAVAHANVAGVALGKLCGDEFGSGGVLDLGAEAGAEIIEEHDVAAHRTSLQQRGPDRQVGLGEAEHLVDRCALLAELQAEVPEQIQHRFDALFDPGVAAFRAEEQDVDVRMTRHLRAAIAAQGDNRQALARGAVGGGVQPGHREVVDQRDDGVRRPCIGGGDHHAFAGRRGKAGSDPVVGVEQRSLEQGGAFAAERGGVGAGKRMQGRGDGGAVDIGVVRRPQGRGQVHASSPASRLSA